MVVEHLVGVVYVCCMLLSVGEGLDCFLGLMGCYFVIAVQQGGCTFIECCGECVALLKERFYNN